MDQPRRSTWASYLTIAAICLVVLVPAIFAGVLEGEQPRWIEARFYEAQLNGDYEAALAAVEELIADSPDQDARYRLWRVQTLNQAGEHQAAINAGEALVKNYPGPWPKSAMIREARQDQESRSEAEGDAELEQADSPNQEPVSESTDASDTKPVDEPTPALTIDDFPHYQELSIAYQATGDFDEALAVLLKCQNHGLKEADGRTINNLSYARSLAGKGVLLALVKMEEIVAPEYNEATLFHLSGYHHSILLRDGEREFMHAPGLREKVLESALEDYATAIEARAKIVEEAVRITAESKTLEPNSESDVSLDDGAQDASDGSSPDGNGTEEQGGESNDKSSSDSENDVPDDLVGRNRRELALIIAHRAKMFESVGDQENADADWERVRDLGFSPQALAKQELDLIESGKRIGSLAQWLDTRGHLKYRVRNYSGAKIDFKRAIRLMESYISLQRLYRVSQSQKSPDVRNNSLRIRIAERSLAAMLYHVLEVELKLGDAEKAEQCRQRIEALGFELGPHLH